MTLIGREGSGYQDACLAILNHPALHAINSLSYLGSNWNPSKFTPLLSQWYHCVFTISSEGVQTLYLNGSQKFQINSPTVLNCSPDIPFMIGASSSYGNPNGIRVPFQGYMSDVRVYDRALLSNEVASLYAIESGVPQLLQLTSQPRDVQLSDTNTQAATFTVVATNGVAPISYQWMKDGVALTNQTNTSLILSNAGANTVCYYSC